MTTDNDDIILPQMHCSKIGLTYQAGISEEHMCNGTAPSAINNVGYVGEVGIFQVIVTT